MTSHRTSRLVWLAIAPALLYGCAMQNPQEDPVIVKLNELERRLSAVERILANGSLVDMAMQVDNLQRMTAELSGQVETLEYQAEETADRQRDLYQDLDQRIQELEQRLQASSGGPLAPGQLPVPGGSDRDNYQAAFELLKEQRYEDAAIAFERFLETYPDSELADNAQYWLAESYYVTGQFEEALAEFEAVISEYPDSRKAADALLKMGYCNYELERWDAARNALQRVQREFPETTAARLADQRLVRMREEGA
ncbi:MAG TPA: tol-pal system protein YbgF [Woeseiaceae bacterium]|nr:tol-pal system protein YbgF [Woeseiaceae bacterium]